MRSEQILEDSGVSKSPPMRTRSATSQLPKLVVASGRQRCSDIVIAEEPGSESAGGSESKPDSKIETSSESSGGETSSEGISDFEAEKGKPGDEDSISTESGSKASVIEDPETISDTVKVPEVSDISNPNLGMYFNQLELDFCDLNILIDSNSIENIEKTSVTEDLTDLGMYLKTLFLSFIFFKILIR